MLLDWEVSEHIRAADSLHEMILLSILLFRLTFRNLACFLMKHLIEQASCLIIFHTFILFEFLQNIFFLIHCPLLYDLHFLHLYPFLHYLLLVLGSFHQFNFHLSKIWFIMLKCLFLEVLGIHQAQFSKIYFCTKFILLESTLITVFLSIF